jgi:hypothetical protein
MSETSPTLRLCDACCDKSGTLKELVKTGGCTCDVCGFAAQYCGGEGMPQFINMIHARLIPDEGWPVLQNRNADAGEELDWEALFELGRD